MSISFSWQAVTASADSAMAATRSIELEIVILLYIMLVKAYSDFAVEGAPLLLQAEIVVLQGSIADVSAFKRKIVPSVLCGICQRDIVA